MLDDSMGPGQSQPPPPKKQRIIDDSSDSEQSTQTVLETIAEVTIEPEVETEHPDVHIQQSQQTQANSQEETDYSEMVVISKKLLHELVAGINTLNDKVDTLTSTVNNMSENINTGHSPVNSEVPTIRQNNVNSNNSDWDLKNRVVHK